MSIQIEITGKIAFLIIDAKLGTFNQETIREFLVKFAEISNNPKISVIILKSTDNKIFSAGYDLKMVQSMETSEFVNFMLSESYQISQSIMLCPKPVIGQIQGAAIGLGCILANSVDFRIVAENDNMFFQLPEIDLNIFPATGPIVSAVSTLGGVHAKDMLMTGRKVFYKELKSWNIFTQTCPLEELDNVTLKFAKSLSRKNPLILSLIKTPIQLLEKKSIEKNFSLENSFARYYFAKAAGAEKTEIIDFIKSMKEKYGM